MILCINEIYKNINLIHLRVEIIYACTMQLRINAKIANQLISTIRHQHFNKYDLLKNIYDYINSFFHAFVLVKAFNDTPCTSAFMCR